MNDSNNRAVRVRVAIVIGLVFAALAAWRLSIRPPKTQGADFAYAWVAARALVAGQDVYAVVGPENVPWAGKLNYPYTVALLVAPVAPFPVWFGGLLLVGLGAGLLAYGVTARGWWALLLFASPSAYFVANVMQWSALLTAAAFYAPLLGVAACAKPTIAFAMLLHHTRLRSWLWAAGVYGALLAASLAINSHWPEQWLHILRTSPSAWGYGIPAKRLVGLPLLAAALKWRRPEARMLLVMACIPQMPFLYDQLPLFLVPRSAVEMIVLLLCSYIVVLAPLSVLPVDHSNMITLGRDLMPLVTVGVYLPALVMVLRRPNESPDGGTEWRIGSFDPLKNAGVQR